MILPETNLTDFVDCNIEEALIVVPRMLRWVEECEMVLSGIRQLRPNPFYEVECMSAVGRYHAFLREYPVELDIDATVILGKPVNRPSWKAMWYTGITQDLPRIETALSLWKTSLDIIMESLKKASARVSLSTEKK